MRPLSRRVSFLTAILFAFSVVAAPPPSPEEGVSQSLKSFTQFYSVVEQNFADSAKVDTAIYEGAIPGMLNTLDPHSHFFDPKEFAAMQEDNRETYFGTGMSVRPDNKKTDRGLRRSRGRLPIAQDYDPVTLLSAVDGRSTDGMDTNSITVLLKGPRGPHVRVTVTRVTALNSRSRSILSATRSRVPACRKPCWAAAGHRLRESEPVQGKHQQRIGRQLEEVGRKRDQGPGAGSSGESRRLIVRRD